MKFKRGNIEKSALIQVILIALVFAFFLIANASRSESRGVRREILENQIALLIESGVPGMSFTINRLNANGIVNDIKLEGGRVFVSVDGLVSLLGRPYFSSYDVEVLSEDDEFIIIIK